MRIPALSIFSVAILLAAGCVESVVRSGADAGKVDGGAVDSGAVDSGVIDAGTIDGSRDAGTNPPDAGDGGSQDAGPSDGGSPVSVGGLAPFNVNPDTVTVSGISAGGFMAVQLMVAYSASFHGAAIVAGGPYDCYQDENNDTSLAECTTGLGIGANASAFVSFTKTQAAMGTIDPVSNISGKPIYMFSGTNDLVVEQPVMDALQQYLEAFTPASNITYNNTTLAEHAWISPDAIHTCDVLASPFINNCGFDMEQDFLTKFYGSLSARSSSPQGAYVQFDQNAFCAGQDCSTIGMDSTAWLYVPSACAADDACRLLLVLHGCLQNQEDVGTPLIHGSGVNEWADGNNLLVLYPQAKDLAQNDCWDFTSYTGGDYDLKSAPQMTAIMGMVSQITSGAK